MFQDELVQDQEKLEEKRGWKLRCRVKVRLPIPGEAIKDTKVHQRMWETVGKQPSVVNPENQVRRSGWKKLFGLKGGGPNPGNAIEEEKLMAVENEGFLAGVNLEVSSDFLSWLYLI